MSRRRPTRSGAPVEVAVDGRVAVVTLARPATGNVLDDEVMHGLVEATASVADRDELCGVVLRGRGGAFSLGLPARVAWPPPSWPDGIAAIAALPMPVIAAVRGEARGWGVALALACDFRVMGSGAVFALPEAAAGRLPGGGVTPRLARLVGPARAAHLVLLGTRVSGRDAASWGLASRAVPARAVDATAIGMARTLASRGPLALRYAKEAVLRAFDLSLDDGVRLEQDLYVLLQTTRDRREGVRAFLERRAPRFEAR